jgi:hypothetical protein
VLDFAKTETDRGVLELIFSRQEMAYPVVAPPGVPAERVQMLRQALAATVKDPEYLADAKRQTLETDAVSGADIAALIDRLYQSPPEVVARAKAALEDGKKITVSSTGKGATVNEIAQRCPTTSGAPKCARSRNLICRKTAGFARRALRRVRQRLALLSEISEGTRRADPGTRRSDMWPGWRRGRCPFRHQGGRPRRAGGISAVRPLPLLPQRRLPAL